MICVLDIKGKTCGSLSLTSNRGLTPPPLASLAQLTVGAARWYGLLLCRVLVGLCVVCMYPLG